MSTDLVANFKSTGAQQMATDFKNVGTASGTAAGGISKASTASQGLGKTMKGSAAGIGNMATAFATLSLSIVNTYRSYRDLGDAQIAVTQSNIKLEKSQNKLNDMKLKAEALQKKEAKGGLVHTGNLIKQEEAYRALQLAIKDHGKGSLEARSAQQKYNEEVDKGKTGGGLYAEALKDIAIQEDVVAQNTTKAGEAQEQFNDTQQNFYLSILPTALSGFGSLALAMNGIKGIFTGGGRGGLIGMFGPLGIAIGGISLAIVAFQTNFLGIRDIIGGVINWVKERLGLWKQGFEDVFSFISKGDWEGAFNRIKIAAAAFWADLVKSVPLFGSIATLVNKIRTGNWKGAFLMIWKAAKDAWETIKQNVPILGKIEDIVRAISEGKWSEAFQKIADAAKQVFSDTLGKGIAFFFGPNWKLGFDAAVALMLAKATANKVHPVVQLVVDVNATIAKVTGFDILAWFKAHPITAAIPFAGGITMMVDDPQFRGAIAAGSLIIINALGAALGRVANLLDPYFSQVIKALSWNNIINTVGSTIELAGKGIWNFLFSGLKNGFQNQDWTKMFQDLGKTVNEWWATNAPEVQQALIGGYEQSLAGQTFKFPVEPEVSPDTPKIIQNGINATGQRGQYKVPTKLELNTSSLPAELKKQVDPIVNRMKPKIVTGANTQPFTQDLNKAIENARRKKVVIPVLYRNTGNVGLGPGKASIWGASGYSGIVRQPTTFVAGEGGREEHVSITPRGSTGHSGGGGGGDTIVNVGPIYLDGEQIYGKMRYKINENQSVFK